MKLAGSASRLFEIQGRCSRPGNLSFSFGGRKGAGQLGLGNWLRKTFGGSQPSQEMVPFFDPESERVVRIPVSELRPGAIQVRLQGSNEVVWALPQQFHQGEVKHPEFDEGVRNYIRRIQAAFAEHRPLSFEEWEEGFRRDANPGREIAIWSHAADIYSAFTAGEASPERRRDVYRCIGACMTTGPKDVWHVLRPEVLSRAETEQVVNRFFGKQAEPGGAPDRGGKK